MDYIENVRQEHGDEAANIAKDALAFGAQIAKSAISHRAVIAGSATQAGAFIAIAAAQEGSQGGVTEEKHPGRPLRLPAKAQANNENRNR